MANDNNGSTVTRLTWWIISTVTGIAIGVSGAVVGHHNTAIVHHAERLSSLEAQMHQQAQRFDRLETKIDRLLERVKP
jgi:hypothetical protein